MEIIATAAMPWEPTPVNTRGGKVSRKILREGELLPGLGFYARLVKYHAGDSVFTVRARVRQTDPELDRQMPAQNRAPDRTKARP